MNKRDFDEYDLAPDKEYDPKDDYYEPEESGIAFVECLVTVECPYCGSEVQESLKTSELSDKTTTLLHCHNCEKEFYLNKTTYEG